MVVILIWNENRIAGAEGFESGFDGDHVEAVSLIENHAVFDEASSCR